MARGKTENRKRNATMNDGFQRLVYSKEIIQEIGELSEAFGIQRVADAAFNFYLKCLLLRQQGYRIIAVPSEGEAEGGLRKPIHISLLD